MIADDDTDFFNYLSITVFFIALVLVGLYFVGLFLNKSVENYLSGCSIICWVTFFLFIDIIIPSLLTYKKFKAWGEFCKDFDKNNTDKRETGVTKE